MGKTIYKCEFGFAHKEANCRCNNPHVDIKQIKCDKPDEHKPKDFPETLQAEIETPPTVEYKTYMLSVGSEAPYLNSLAQEGWRVVGFSVQYPKSYFVLERKK